MMSKNGGINNLRNSTVANWQAKWAQTKVNYLKWWNHRGMILFLVVKTTQNAESPPVSAGELERWWTDPQRRCERAEREISSRIYLGDAFPVLPIYMGPGSLGTFLGAQPHFMPDTVWYEPCITDSTLDAPVNLNLIKNKWWNIHSAFLSEALRRNKGRYIVGLPDLIENLDTLAAMRGSAKLLFDLIERPTWVHSSLEAINEAYFRVFELLHATVRDEDGGNTDVGMGLWGPGKTCKIQCDFSCMISSQMFNEFAIPYLTDQCEWLDYSVYHLDGTSALQHLNSLLKIESLDAIQWTPQAGMPQAGSPHWYALYRRIKDAGKSVMALNVKANEVSSLIDAVGPEGLFVSVFTDDLRTAEGILKATKYPL